MQCCAECFGDRGLRKNIIPSRSRETGTCSYCNSIDIPILPPTELSEYFELLISAYRREDGGKLLVHWFRQDWGLFQHPRMDNPRAKELLAEVLDDGEIVRQAFVPAKDIPAAQLTKWETLRGELMYRNRFFPQADINLDRLEELLSSLHLDEEEVPNVWYRARIQSTETPFPISEMGAPPNRIASHGRANPAGIPYLYLGSTQTNAISEIRPHTGEMACVADFTTPLDLKLVDLRNPRKMVSPFIYEGAEDILKLRADLPFLEQLGDELTRPVLPQSAAIDYTPSQYLCEFIKKCGYQGVIYRSSVSNGINLALFDPSLAQPGSVTQYRVARVSIDVAATHIEPTGTQRDAG
jgi:hypothetical protein